jgi:hypothetical protein
MQQQEMLTVPCFWRDEIPEILEIDALFATK